MPANQKRTKPRRAVILTALRVEYEAVRSHLTDPHEETHKSGTVYERGTLATDDGQPWEVGIVEIGVGNERAAQETDRAITHFRPSIVIFVGVAGGIKDVALGDVVAGTKVYGYESGKAEATFKPRPSVGNSSYNLEQRARAEARKADWLNRLGAAKPETTPNVFVGPIAAGEKVIGSTRSAVWKFIRKNYNDALAVEMEGHGFLQAAFASKVDAIVIRGISDLIEGKFEADAKGWQEIAARHAAAFAFEVLAKLETATPITSLPATSSNKSKVTRPEKSTDNPQTISSVRNIPHLRNRNFTGREELLSELYANLTSGKPAAVVQAIRGLGGVGKTQLALEYCYRHAAEYQVIWWIRAQGVTTLASDYAALSEAVGLPSEKIADQNLVVGMVRRWLSEKQNWLLIFDNAEEPSQIQPYIPDDVTGHILITSQNPNWGSIASSVPIEVFESAEAVQFLLARTKRTDQSSAEALAKALGNLPLALEQAGAYMESTGRTLGEYLDLFESHQEVLLKQEGATSLAYPYTIATTWDLSIQQVHGASPAAVDLLNLCAYLAPDDIPRPVLASGARFSPEPLATIVQDPLTFDSAIAALRRYSLIGANGAQLSVHRLVRVVVRDKMGEDARRIWVEAAVRLIDNALQFDINDPKTWADSAALLPHALTAAKHAEAFQVANEVTGHLLNQVGRYLTTRAEYGESEKAFRRALALRETTLGNNHPDTAESLNDLGWVLGERGDYTNRRALYERALAIREKVFGLDHPDTAQSLSNIGASLGEEGDYVEARLYQERALAVRERVLGPDHPDTAQSLGSLGTVLRDQGDYAGAHSYQERALSIREKVLGPDHPDTAQSLNSIGVLLTEEGNYLGACRYHERALAIREKILGTNHPDIGVSLHNLGIALQGIGDYTKAQKYLEQALFIGEAMFGKTHPSNASTLTGLGEILHQRRNLAGARQYAERALVIDETTLGMNHPDTAKALNNLGAILLEQGQFVQARTYLERALEISKSQLGVDHPMTHKIEVNLEPLRPSHRQRQHRKH